MANPEHVALLKQNVEKWNDWRLGIWANLDEVDLSTANQVHLHEADLSEADLSEADLRWAELSEADLSGAHLSEADLSGAHLSGAHLSGADLRWADLNRAILSGADLSRADLCEAELNRAILSGADLRGADLRWANLSGANLSGANLSGANPTSPQPAKPADLRWANLSGANLSGANLSGATAGRTIFADVTFGETKGLDSVIHQGPSSIGIDTVYNSRGNIPEVFLRGAGVPEPFIVHMKALVGAMEPIQFYSCIIGYCSKDQGFAERLYADLQNKGLRCWYAPEDMKIRDRLCLSIDESIKVHEKLLLVLSETSIKKSAWVQHEVRRAMLRERPDGPLVLFPIRLDDTVMSTETGWPALIETIWPGIETSWPALVKRTRHIGDFRAWETHASYQKAFVRLLRDLKA